MGEKILSVILFTIILSSGFATSALATSPPPKYDGTIGVVTIAFDHGFYDQVNPMLYMKNDNFTGTLWVVTNRSPSQNPLLFPWSQAQSLYNLGFEMESHSRIHLSEANGFDNATLYSEIYGSKQDLQNQGMLVCGFVPPSSSWNATTIQIIKKFYNYSAQQTITQNSPATLSNTKAMWGVPLVRIMGVANLDPTQLSYIQNFTAAKFQIDKAINNKGWVVLHFHDIVNITSGFAGLQYPASFSLYQQIIDYIKSKTDAGVLREMTESQAMGFGQRCEIITDKTPPVVSTPAGISLIVPSTSGVKVNYTANATDNVGLLNGPTCDSASGSVFPIGNTTVTCTATDWAGNVGKSLFVVSIKSDTTPPTINVPSGITAEATSPAGAQVNYTVTANDIVGITSGPTCNTPSGSVFPIGNTTVTCTASDAGGNIATKSFSVIVSDTTPPTITAPPNVTLQATGSLTQVNLGTPIVNDTVDLHPIVTNNASSTGYPPGKTVVVWKATDYSGNSANAIQQITITQIPSTLTLNSISNMPWGNMLTISGRLTNSVTSSGVANKTISFNGTGAINLPPSITDANGYFTSSGAAPSTVLAGWTVQAHFAGDAVFAKSNSQINTFGTTKHGVSLLVTSKNVPWSTATTFTATLTDLGNGAVISGKTIHFNGTGVIGVSDQTTNSKGMAVGTGTAPSSIATGWKYQAHFAGDSLYVAKDSKINTYNTLQHNTGLTLSIPASVKHGVLYTVTGTLTDTSTGTPLSSKTITFTATSPITIPNTLTVSTGKYTVSSLVAPSAGSYNIQAKYAGETLYAASNSPNKTLSVT